MAYGHMPLFFADAVEAQGYLDNCRAANNYTAENYQDRVAAQRCLRHAAGWAPVPLPAPTSSKTRAQARPTRRAKQSTK